MSDARPRTPAAPRPWHLYLIRTARGTLYTGITTDVPRRLDQHLGAGSRASKYLRAHAPAKLVYQLRIGTHSLALRTEHRIKRLAKSEKERIVAVQPRLRTLLRLLEICP